MVRLNMHQQPVDNFFKIKDPEGLTLNHLAKEFGDPLFDLDAFVWQKLHFDTMTKNLIAQYQALPLHQRNNQLFLALSHPDQYQAQSAFQFHTGLNVQIVIVEKEKLSTLIDKVLHHQTLSPDESSATPILDKIFNEAIQQGASDIHFEPFQDHCRIRFRQDSILVNHSYHPNAFAIKLITRLKILSQLDIAEKRLPQDGHFKLPLANQKTMDMRVSICPTLHGEKAVVRLLDPSQLHMGIEMLGMEKNQESAFIKAIHQPQGIILITGPTGSGKTVTLYSALATLNAPDVNISTIEDPIEIQLPGINQVNIHPKIGLTFAHALRAFLRQDPDIMMVGEIRDKETAEIAICAAQTGHLVFSSLHTNSAAEAIARLLNLEVPQYNLTSIQMVIAQRLIRKLCPYCKKEAQYSPTLLQEIAFPIEKETVLYQAQGCNQCFAGYKGRIGIFEILDKGESFPLLTLKQAGFLKVKAGLSSLEEVLRVTG